MRIAKRIALAVAVPVLLLSAYVCSYLVVNSAMNSVSASAYAWPIYDRVFPLWRPIWSYERSNLPFSVEFRGLDLWCWHLGSITWHEAYELAEDWKRQIPP